MDRAFFTSFTPMQMMHILKHSADSFRRFRKVLIGGSAVTNVLEQALRNFSNEIYETYGMTETISHVAVRRLNGNSHFFHALPGVRFRKDMTGRLVISAQHLGAEEVVTNDVVSLSGQQSFQFLGRIDNVINSGGIKLFPEKIERSIANLIVSDYFLIKEPDLELGERMVMYIEGTPYEAQELLRLRSAMKLLLDNYELPKDIRFHEKFERTVSGKVIRRLY
jgi:o-succinylbenzoate---CoA ligase